MKLSQEQQEIIESVELKKGSHEAFNDGACLMELVSYIAGEPWSDNPECACPVLTSSCIRFNDQVDYEYRQKLKTLIPKLLNSRDESKKKIRTGFFVLQAITKFLPILTDAFELNKISERLRLFKMGQWTEARDYINSVSGEIRSEVSGSSSYLAAHAASFVAVAVTTAHAAFTSDITKANAAAAAAIAYDATSYAAAYATDAAHAAYLSASSKDKKFWLDVKFKIWNAWFDAINEACDL